MTEIKRIEEMLFTMNTDRYHLSKDSQLKDMHDRKVMQIQSLEAELDILKGRV